MTGVKMASSICRFLMVAVLARYFTVSEVGLFFFATAMVYLFSQIPGGFSRAVKKRVSERNSHYIQFYAMTVLFIAAYLVVLYALSLILKSTGSLSVGDIGISDALIMACFVGVLGKSCSKMGQRYISGLGYPALSQGVVFSLYVFGQLTIVSYYVIVKEVTDVLLIFQTAQLAGILVMVAAFVITVFLDGIKISDDVLSDVLSVLKFAKWSIVTDIFNDLYHRIDTVFLAFFISSVVVGYYESSVRIMSLAAALPSSTNKVLTIKISGYSTEDKDYTMFFERYVKMILIFTVSTVIIVYIFGQQILEIGYGSSYISAYPIFVALMTQLVLQSLRGSFRSLFHGIDKPRIVTKVTVITVIANILTAPLFIIVFNGVGMVIATIVSELSRVVYFYYIYRYKTLEENDS